MNSPVPFPKENMSVEKYITNPDLLELFEGYIGEMKFQNNGKNLNDTGMLTNFFLLKMYEIFSDKRLFQDFLSYIREQFLIGNCEKLKKKYGFQDFGECLLILTHIFFDIQESGTLENYAPIQSEINIVSHILQKKVRDIIQEAKETKNSKTGINYYNLFMRTVKVGVFPIQNTGDIGVIIKKIEGGYESYGILERTFTERDINGNNLHKGHLIEDLETKSFSVEDLDALIELYDSYLYIVRGLTGELGKKFLIQEDTMKSFNRLREKFFFGYGVKNLNNLKSLSEEQKEKLGKGFSEFLQNERARFVGLHEILKNKTNLKSVT